MIVATLTAVAKVGTTSRIEYTIERLIQYYPSTTISNKKRYGSWKRAWCFNLQHVLIEPIESKQ